MKHLTVTLLILAAAMACYALGWSTSFVAFLVVGGAFELWFWLRAIRGEKERKVQ
jgi:hypothetical protein